MNGIFRRLKEELNNYLDEKFDDSDPAAESLYLNKHNKVVDNFEFVLSLDNENFDNNCGYDMENCFRDEAVNFDNGNDDDDDDDDDNDDDNDGDDDDDDDDNDGDDDDDDDKNVSKIYNQLSFNPNSVAVTADDKPDYIYF
ncbi:uncharacterized protein LOC144645754 [Oculina patagonica]